jgi:hypothetical protein
VAPTFDATTNAAGRTPRACVAPAEYPREDLLRWSVLAERASGRTSCAACAAAAAGPCSAEPQPSGSEKEAGTGYLRHHREEDGLRGPATVLLSDAEMRCDHQRSVAQQDRLAARAPTRVSDLGPVELLLALCISVCPNGDAWRGCRSSGVRLQGPSR